MADQVERASGEAGRRCATSQGVAKSFFSSRDFSGVFCFKLRYRIEPFTLPTKERQGASRKDEAFSRSRGQKVAGHGLLHIVTHLLGEKHGTLSAIAGNTPSDRENNLVFHSSVRPQFG